MSAYWIADRKFGCPWAYPSFHCPNCGEVHDCHLMTWEEYMAQIPGWMWEKMLQDSITVMKQRRQRRNNE